MREDSVLDFFEKILMTTLMTSFSNLKKKSFFSHNTTSTKNLDFFCTTKMAVSNNETVDYSKELGVYNHKWKRWEWTDEYRRPHRKGDKPALIYDNGLQIWCEDGVMHRLNGKAWICPDGSSFDAWYINGSCYWTEEEFLAAREDYNKGPRF